MKTNPMVKYYFSACVKAALPLLAVNSNLLPMYVTVRVCFKIWNSAKYNMQHILFNNLEFSYNSVLHEFWQKKLYSKSSSDSELDDTGSSEHAMLLCLTNTFHSDSRNLLYFPYPWYDSSSPKMLQGEVGDVNTGLCIAMLNCSMKTGLFPLIT
jgi:hypothetical protein